MFIPKKWPWTGASKGKLESDESTIRRFCSMLALNLSECYTIYNKTLPVRGFLDIVVTMELGQFKFSMNRIVPMKVLRRLESEEALGKLVSAVLVDIDTTMLAQIKATAHQQQTENEEEDWWKLGPKEGNDADG